MHIAAGALCLSLDGSICPRQGVWPQAGEVRKEVPRIAARGQAVKKGLRGMKGGMRGIKMGEGYYSPTPILLQVFVLIPVKTVII